jgi:predicted dehydrogenase
MTFTDISRRDFIRATATAAAAFSAGLAASQEELVAQTTPAAGGETVRVGIIGAGSQGRNDLGQALRVPGLKCVAVCDIFEPNLKKGLEMAGPDAKSYTDYRKMLEQPDIDAVMVCTPLNWHARMAVDAMQAGKHVFSEKMMAYSIEEARQMVRTAAETDRLLQVGHQRRYNPTYLHALNLIRKENVLGRITHIRCVWHRNNDWRRPLPPGRKDLETLINWRLYRAASQGLMAELGSHMIDVCNWFLGAVPTAVCGMGGIDYWKDGRETDDNVEVVFEYPDGVKVVFTSVTTNAYDNYYEQIMGDKGTLVLTAETKGLLFQEQRAEKLEWADFAHKEDVGGKGGIVLNAQATPGKKPQEGAATSSQDLAKTGENPYYLEMLDFVRCIGESDHPRCCAHVAHESDVACLMANASIHQRRFINLPPDIYAVPGLPPCPHNEGSTS